jgi:hypothetical protein
MSSSASSDWITSAACSISIMRAQWKPRVARAARPSAKARNSRRSASASGEGMKSQPVTRVNGPTRYQPRSGPSARRKGNFM